MPHALAYAVWALQALLPALHAAAVESADGVCSAAGGCGGGWDRAHPWPNVRGNVGRYGISEVKAPRDLSKPSWRWHHPSGQYGTVITGGPVIDDELNLYIVEMKAVRKFSPDGRELWSQLPEPYYEVSFPDGPSIMGDRIFVSTTNGELCAFAIGDGRLLWRRKYFPETGSDSKYVTSHDGVVIIGTDHAFQEGGGSKHVVAVDAGTGDKLWDFKPDTPTWNNMGIFDGEDTVVFQDWDAKVYRLGLRNGTLLWKSGGMSRSPIKPVVPYSETWTDGGALIGADGVVYAVSSKVHQDNLTSFGGGGVHAYRLSDGALLWERDVPHPVLTWPVAARVGGGPEHTVFVFPGGPSGGFSDEALLYYFVFERTLPTSAASLLVTAALLWAGARRRLLLPAAALAWLAAVAFFSRDIIHYRLFQGTPSDIYAYKAGTGELLWKYELDFMKRKPPRGESEGEIPRRATPWRGGCGPVAYSSPSVDGDGVVLIGHMSGKFFGVKDWNGDGEISSDEVSVFDAEAAFLHSGPAFAPGLFAFTTCDSLWVWRL